jgi:hypothetical protein
MGCQQSGCRASVKGHTRNLCILISISIAVIPTRIWS